MTEVNEEMKVALASRASLRTGLKVFSESGQEQHYFSFREKDVIHLAFKKNKTTQPKEQQLAGLPSK